jgi:hypothetical protein
VLAWAAERSHNRDPEQDYGQLIGQLIERGWTEASSPAVRCSLAALLAALAGSPRWGLGMRPDRLPWAENIDVERRRELAVAVAERLSDAIWYQLLRLGLLRATDADWLATAKTDVSAWWRVAYWLAAGDRPGEALFTHDLTTRSGWALLSEDEQVLVFDLGWRYLNEHVLQPSDWRDKETITTNEVLPDWSGVYLMTTLVRYHAARVSSLEPAVWETWAPAIVGAWNFDAGDDARLRCDLVDLAPALGRARIIAAALDHLDALAANDRHLTPDPLFDHLCVELAPQIADRIAAKQYGTSSPGHCSTS